MKIIYNNIILFKGFTAINLFGVVFARKDIRITKIMLRHEAIHTEQMKELWYISFYILYVLNWLYNMVFRGLTPKVAYFNILFEREAYGNERNRNYLTTRKKFNWLYE